MERDLRDTDLYRAIEEHFRGRSSRVRTPSRRGRSRGGGDGSRLAFTRYRLDRLEGGPSSSDRPRDLRSGDVEEVTAGPNDDRLPVWSPTARPSLLLEPPFTRPLPGLPPRPGTVGEAEALPEVDGSVESIAWFPRRPAAAGHRRRPGRRPGWGGRFGGDGEAESLPRGRPTSRARWRRRVAPGMDRGSRGRETARIGDDTTTIWEACWMRRRSARRHRVRRAPVRVPGTARICPDRRRDRCHGGTCCRQRRAARPPVRERRRLAASPWSRPCAAIGRSWPATSSSSTWPRAT